MNALKRRKLSASSAHATLKRAEVTKTASSNPADTSVLSHLFTFEYEIQNTVTKTQEIESLLKTSNGIQIPVERFPVVPGLCSVTIKMPENYVRPKSGMPLITFAQQSERSGVLQTSNVAGDERFWSLYTDAIESVNTYATFQYHGVVHTRQGIELPASISNIDTLITQFHGSIPQHQSNEDLLNPYYDTMYDLFNSEELCHTIFCVKDKTKYSVGKRWVEFLNTSINQGPYRKWLLSPGQIIQRHYVNLYHKDILKISRIPNTPIIDFITFSIDQLYLIVFLRDGRKVNLEWWKWESEKSPDDEKIIIFEKQYQSCIIRVHKSSRVGNRNDMAFLFKK